MKKFLIALQFLTIIPVRLKNVEEKELSGSVNYYPVVGLLIGFLLAGSWLLLSIVFPVTVSALVVTGIYLLLTGALHLDGFADTVDGLYGGRTKEDIFRIMESSTIGAKGAAFTFLLLGLKIILISSLSTKAVYPALILFPVLSRYSITILMKYSDYAKENGLRKAYCGKISNISFLIINLASAGAALIFGVKGLVAFLTVALMAIIIKNYFNKKIGGVTGDIFGFTIETAETVVLLIFVAGF